VTFDFTPYKKLFSPFAMTIDLHPVLRNCILLVYRVLPFTLNNEKLAAMLSQGYHAVASFLF
jgi:hypothetical protein